MTTAEARQPRMHAEGEGGTQRVEISSHASTTGLRAYPFAEDRRGVKDATDTSGYRLFTAVYRRAGVVREYPNAAACIRGDAHG
jgi:hypothetical protein